MNRVRLELFQSPISRETGVMASVLLEEMMGHDIQEELTRRIASYMARIYIKHNRDKIEAFVTHPATQKRIAREVRKILEKTIDTL